MCKSEFWTAIGLVGLLMNLLEDVNMDEFEACALTFAQEEEGFNTETCKKNIQILRIAQQACKAINAK